MPTTILVCLLPARNAEADLPEYLASASKFCDAIVALDDGSTDATAELLAASPLVKVLLRNPRRESYRGWDDAENRNRLLEAAAKLDPQWIISVDADERLDPDDAAALRRFVAGEARPGSAYGLRIYSMWRDLTQYHDQFLWVYRLFSYAPGQSFPRQRLHLVPVPVQIPFTDWYRTTLRLQHVGGMTEARRRARFEKYAEADPDCTYQADYSNLRLDPPAALRQWPARPAGLPVLLTTAPEGPGRPVPTDPESVDPGPAMSAIVISRDDEATIARTVASVVEQHCQESFEVIVVTSGADRTAEIVRERFPRVTLVELSRPALPGVARNAGLRLARGEIVTFPGSHVELPPGSLAARLRAHRRGFAMVTGITLNGTHTWAGWASYFLDHAFNLPGLSAAVLPGPPAHCSYLRGPLLEVGGFPEQLRAGEDTAVNTALARRDYVAYRDPEVRIIHHSPCRTPWRLLTHHFVRGQGLGRLCLRDADPTGHLLTPHFLNTRLLRYLPYRLRETSRSVLRAPWAYRWRYVRASPLVLAGATAAWLGLWWEILRPGRGKLDLLFGQPIRTLFVLAVRDGRVRWMLLARLDLPARRWRALRLPVDLPIPSLAGATERLDEALGFGPGTGANRQPLAMFRVRDVMRRAFDLFVDDFAIVDPDATGRRSRSSADIAPELEILDIPGSLKHPVRTSMTPADLWLLRRSARWPRPQVFQVTALEPESESGAGQESSPSGSGTLAQLVRQRLGLTGE